jgi:type III pantothenate kinase
MLLLDIGNTNIKIFDGKNSKRVEAKKENLPSSEFCYINVNPNLENVLKNHKFAIDLKPFFHFQTNYRGIGIDRVAACYSIETGVVVDAGSAITVDIMDHNLHKGGFILPGIRSYKDSFANISSRLIYDLESEISLTGLPQNTNDALLYATMKSIVCMIEIHAADKQVYLTGGDGRRLSYYLKEAVFEEDLVFKGMQKVIKEMGLSC